ncbi:hypothetical protein TPENAI_60775 [Tenacibaculum litopenaei]|uniref:hypothetical protein n=1 Tax=Tenacibaculum litopenaei TaxID=396016 RepID=UPI003893E687
MSDLFIKILSVSFTFCVLFMGGCLFYNEVIYPVNKITETSLFEEDALKIIENKDGCEELNRIVKDYHKTGEWDMEALRKLTAKFK